MEPARLRHNWVAKVQEFVRRPIAVERCELCHAAIPPGHAHLIDPAARRLICACEACALVLGGGADGRYRSVPRRAYALPDFRLTDAEWDGLRIPIDMAFLFHSTADDRPVALYPGPAGPVESLLTLDGWSGLVANNPVLAEFVPDVEALLVYRVGRARECYRVPIDRCYELVGLIRAQWRGLSGGSEAWEAIGRYFDRLRDESVPAGGPRPRPHAPGWASPAGALHA
jgi:hypothetical protein